MKKEEKQEWTNTLVMFTDNTTEKFNNMAMEIDEFVVHFTDLTNHKDFYIPLRNVREIIVW